MFLQPPMMDICIRTNYRHQFGCSFLFNGGRNLFFSTILLIEIFDKLVRVGYGVVHGFDQGVDLHLEA